MVQRFLTGAARCAAALVAISLIFAGQCFGAPVLVNENPGRLEVRPAGTGAVRVTLKPASDGDVLPYTPALAERESVAAAISVTEIDAPVAATVGELHVEVSAEPLRVAVTDATGRAVQTLTFAADGSLEFTKDAAPILGMGEGGPLPERGRNWREAKVQFDRNGAVDDMRPRWQGDAYGSRNPVALLVGTSGWAMFVATPWGSVDLRDAERGVFRPWTPPAEVDESAAEGRRELEQMRAQRRAQVQGRPPEDSVRPGVFDVIVFDAREPATFMNALAELTGRAAMPPKWALGYVQSHRTLRDEKQLVEIVDTFREKRIPVDAVIYLGTGFCPKGWNKPQPSYEFNPELFEREPAEVIADLHARHVKVALHVVPFGRERLPTLQGSFPPGPGEPLDATHVTNYWKLHEPLFAAGTDAFWPDEGDWFDFHERMKRHQFYYDGPLSTRPNVRPWSLHRNGHLGVARSGGWVWSGDTQSSWKTLEAQVAVGINDSLSLSPYWGSDIGGFYPNKELTGELYARWFQFGAFCPSFRSHGRTWWTRLPWGWGLSEMGPREDREDPLESELNNAAIEPVCKKYAELRYQLLPYTYTLAREARDTGMPLMRALWLHYPEDATARALGSEYLWGRDLLVAPVFEKGATTRRVYLPAGTWFDWWSNERHEGGQFVERAVDLATMPIYVRAGAIVPVDPVRQYTSEAVTDPTTLRVYAGADGAFTLYEDDGESQAYLDDADAGAATRTRVTWDDAARRVAIEPGGSTRDANGAEIKPRTFRVEVLPEGAIREVIYEGKRMELAM
jgi:alpha-glucosidase (family GH31 glycosyl hydrolase)